MQLNIPPNELIGNFIKKMNLESEYTHIVIKHMTTFLTAMAVKCFKGKMTDVESYSTCHRTTLSHFLSKGKWNDNYLKQVIKTMSFHYIEQKALAEQKPLFVSIDDTVNCKAKPSSRAKKPMQGTGYHHSHLLHKQVWGHQVQAVTVSCMGTALNYDINRYDKEKQSKIDYTVELAQSLPTAVTKSYALTDSWYSCPKIINTFAQKGYHFIGALKTNRIIFPKGIRISIANFAAKYIEQNDVDLITVNSKEYYVYRYEGNLNGIENAVVILSWPKNAFKAKGALKAFICTDVSLETNTMLEYYAARWCIETFFKQEKGNLGFDSYQIRDIIGIERFWLLMSLMHLLCSIGLGEERSFGDGIRFLRNDISRNRDIFIYHCAQNNVPLEDVLFACA